MYVRGAAGELRSVFLSIYLIIYFGDFRERLVHLTPDPSNIIHTHTQTHRHTRTHTHAHTHTHM